MTGSDFGTVRLWNGTPYKATVLLLGHFEAVKTFDFDPTSRFIVTGSSDKTVRIWQVGDGSPVQAFRGHTRSVRKVAFSADGKTVYSRDEDGIELAWDRGSGGRVEINDPARWDPRDRSEAKLPEVVLDDRRVILIDRSVQGGESRLNYCNFKGRIRAAWHRRLAELAESRNQWFAAAFHRAWPVLAVTESELPNESDLKKLRNAHRKAKRFMESNGNGTSDEPGLYFPSKVREALKRLANGR